MFGYLTFGLVVVTGGGCLAAGVWGWYKTELWLFCLFCVLDCLLGVLDSLYLVCWLFSCL